jgi:UDP-2,3-diacylglucosamine pyrophosphatase LpxH
MLVVISDLHFEEENSDTIKDTEGRPTVSFSRNTPAEAYRRLITWFATEARRTEAERMDLVLAGDIFDLHRTMLWFTEKPEPARPYVGWAEVDPELEDKVLRILSAIAAEDEVSGSLEVFRLLAEGRYRESYDPEAEPQNFPVPVHLYYFPGNHDRLAAATPAIRREVRRLLGLSGDDTLFPKSCAFDDPRVLVRHGHEYDSYNFSVDHSDAQAFPVQLPDAEYAAPAFGDFITVEVASRLPFLFRKVHGDNEITSNEVLSATYLRLLEFDDLRPQSALFDFLLTVPDTIPGSHVTQEEVWDTLVPVAKQLLEDIHDHPFLRGWLEKWDSWWPVDRIDLLQGALDARIWRLGIPLQVARGLNNRVTAEDGQSAGPALLAAREKVVLDGSAQFVVAGHTHHPEVQLLATDSRYGQRYYVNTGTWRNRIPSTIGDRSGFGRHRAGTYAIFHGSRENPRTPQGGAVTQEAFFDYWSGFYTMAIAR